MKGKRRNRPVSRQKMYRPRTAFESASELCDVGMTHSKLVKVACETATEFDMSEHAGQELLKNLVARFKPSTNEPSR